MDNLTHSLVGLAASKAGLEKLSPQTTLLCILAANAPDSDILALLFGGRWAFLKYHRGITHSIVGTLALVIILPLIFYLIDRLIARIRERQFTVRLKGLIIAGLSVSATHPLMDWTNSYGIRPLLPLSSQWVYGDLVFIVDPFLWLVFGSACFLLTADSKLRLGFWLLLGLILTYLVITVPRAGLGPVWVLRTSWIVAVIGLTVSFKLGAAKRWGRKIAIAACLVVTLYWVCLAFLHRFAVEEARIEARAIAIQNGENITDVAAMPTLANPFQWQCVVETEHAAYRFDLSLAGKRGPVSSLVRYQRADTSDSPAVARAMQDTRARIFMGFARFPVTSVIGADCITETLVQFADLRYTQPGNARGTFSLELPVDCPSQDAQDEKDE